MAYTDKSKLRVVYGDYTLGVHGKEFNYIFSYAQGGSGIPCEKWI